LRMGLEKHVSFSSLSAIQSTKNYCISSPVLLVTVWTRIVRPDDRKSEISFSWKGAKNILRICSLDIKEKEITPDLTWRCRFKVLTACLIIGVLMVFWPQTGMQQRLCLYRTIEEKETDFGNLSLNEGTTPLLNRFPSLSLFSPNSWYLYTLHAR